MRPFCDNSALLKRRAREQQSDWTRHQVLGAEHGLVTQPTRASMRAAWH